MFPLLGTLEHSLVNFNFSSNPLNDSSASKLVNLLLSKPTRLVTLNLSSIDGMIEFATSLGHAFSERRCPHLTSLDVSRNSLCRPGCAALCSGFLSGHVPLLSSLHLSACNLTADGLRALAQAMRGGAFPSLRDIDLAANNAGEGMVLLATVLRAGACKKLRKIDVANNVAPGEKAGGVMRAFKDEYFVKVMKLEVVTA